MMSLLKIIGWWCSEHLYYIAASTCVCGGAVLYKVVRL